MSRSHTALPGRGHIETSEWVEAEDFKVPDSVPPFESAAKLMTVQVGKGKKKRGVRMRIPRGLLPELKRKFDPAFWDGETLDSPSATASQYALFAQIVQGTNAQNRLGDSIFVDKVVLRLHLEQSTSNTFSTACLAVVMDMEPAAGNPAWTDVFQGIGAATAPAYLNAIPNFDKRLRFSYKERMSIPLSWSGAYWNGSAATVSPHPKQIVMEIPVKRRVSYDNSGGVYRGCELQLFGWSDLTANTPKVWGSYEIFFTDA